MKRFTFAFVALVTILVTFSTTIQGQTTVDQWGFLGGRQGNWIFTPGSAPGGGSIGGNASLSVEWGAIRGGFTAPVTATLSQAIIVTGNIEFIGAGIDTWSGLRYGLFRHDSVGTLITTNVDSTRWSGKESDSHGYMFSPVSGTQRVTDGASGGIGTQWIRISGNYISTGTGSGPVYSGGINIQKPAYAVADAGKYTFAFSVQPLANGTKEVRFYLIKGNVANSATSTYYFGGSFIDTSSITPTFNGVCFAAHATGSGPNPNLRGVKLTDVQVGLGTPFVLPEAPFSSYYVDKWGFLGGRQGNWSFKPDPDGLIGNAGIGGDASLSVEWGAIRGGFLEPVIATTSKAILVTGNIEFIGAGIDTWSGLRYGLFMHDSAGTVITKVDTVGGIIIDSTRWSGKESDAHGYMFCPVSGTQRITDGASGGIGTQWIRINGNYISTGTGSGPVYSGGINTQKPAYAVADAGKYAFAFSVQPLVNGTKEVRFYLIKGNVANSATSTYYFGGSFIDTSSIAPKFNGVVFAVHATGSGPNPDLRGVKLTDVQVDLGTPFVLPEAPWQDFYVDLNQWGVVGGKTGGWKFIPGDLDGNAGIGGTTSNTGLAAIRGSLGGIDVPVGKTIKITGKIILEGGGFDGASALRFGISNGNAGNVINAGTDSARWNGSEANHSGYLFIPRSGTNALPTWGGTANTGSWGAVVKSVWYGPDSSASNYPLGSEAQLPANAIATAGTYDLEIEAQAQANGTNWIGYSLAKNGGGYSVKGVTSDTHSPVATASLNNISFALNSWVGNTTTALKVEDVFVTQSTAFEIPVELTSFSASLIGSDATLNWSTATETNNHGFEVQRNINGGSFATVAFVKGQGTTTQKNDYSFIDKNLVEGKYSYRLKQVDLDGQFNYSNTIEVDVSPVYEFTLEQNYPNPFNPATTINYVLQEKSKVKIVLLNVVGEEVAVLVNGEQEKGIHKIQVDGSNLSSGVYFYKLIANDFVSTKKMILMK